MKTLKPARLAVLLPEVGIRSETFIRRHVQDLVPGGAVAVIDPPPNPVVALQGGPAWNAPGVVIDGNPGPRDASDPPPSASQMASVAATLRALGVEVVLGEYLDFSTRWLSLSRDHGFRFVVHGHGVDITKRLRDPGWRTRYQAYREGVCIIVPTDRARQDLSTIGIPAEVIAVVPYGTDVAGCLLPRIPRQTVTCVAVGRFVPKKSPRAILTAFALAQRRHPHLRLSYVGTGPLHPEAEQLVDELGVRTTVHLPGALEHLETLKVIRSADIFVHASQRDASGDAEGLPLVILEAMAAGVPVVSTDHQGIADAVVDGETGYLVPEGDTTALADRLVTLADSPAMRSRCGEAGWHRARALYSWQRNRRSLLQLLDLDDTSR